MEKKKNLETMKRLRTEVAAENEMQCMRRGGKKWTDLKKRAEAWGDILI